MMKSIETRSFTGDENQIRYVDEPLNCLEKMQKEMWLIWVVVKGKT